MATLVHRCSSADEAIPFDTHSNPPAGKGIDGRVWSTESSSEAKATANCGSATWNEIATTSNELQLLLGLEWVEDSSIWSRVEEVAGEQYGGGDGKFYDKLGPSYKPLPEEEATVAELLRDMNFQEETYAVLVRGQKEASDGASPQSPSPSEHSPASVGSSLQKEVSVTVADHYCQSPAFSVRSSPLDLDRAGLKRKRDWPERESSSEGRKKLRTHEVGFVTPSVFPAFNWMGPDGFTAVSAYLPSQAKLLESEAFKSQLDAEDLVRTTECGADCWCPYGSKLVAGEMRSWRAFKQQHVTSRRRNRLWRSVFVSADELRTTLRRWHTSLKLENPSSCTIALHMYQRRVHSLERTLNVVRGLNVTILLAVSLWVAVKLVDNIAKVPKASIIAATAGVPVKLLTYAEIPLLDALSWKLVRY